MDINFKDVQISMKVLDQSYEDVKHLSQNGLMMFLGTLLDQYGADHGMSSKETCDMLDTLAEIQKQVHNDIGMMPPTGGVA